MAINSSLMTLGRCLEALRWNQQHRSGGNLRVVPYREAKVTHLFRWGCRCGQPGMGGCCAGNQAQQPTHTALDHPALEGLLPPCRDALHGWGQVVLSVNVSPVARDYDETAHVLKVGARLARCKHRQRFGVGSGLGSRPRTLGHCTRLHAGKRTTTVNLHTAPATVPPPLSRLQYAALATQIGTIQQAEAPRRTIKAVSPAIRKVKRKAALPPEARRQGGGGK